MGHPLDEKGSGDKNSVATGSFVGGPFLMVHWNLCGEKLQWLDHRILCGWFTGTFVRKNEFLKETGRKRTPFQALQKNWITGSFVFRMVHRNLCLKMKNRRNFSSESILSGRNEGGKESWRREGKGGGEGKGSSVVWKPPVFQTRKDIRLAEDDRRKEENESFPERKEKRETPARRPPRIPLQATPPLQGEDRKRGKKRGKKDASVHKMQSPFLWASV